MLRWLRKRKNYGGDRQPQQWGLVGLPGSKERIEKALTLPTTGAVNPFLARLDPKKKKKGY